MEPLGWFRLSDWESLPEGLLPAFSPQPETHPATVDKPGITANRHDDHNIEIKIFRELKNSHHKEEFDLFFFIPRSFDIPFWGKAELQKDFRVRMRASIPNDRALEDNEIDASRGALEHVLKMYLQAQGMSLVVESIDTMVLDTSRDVGALYVEWIKKQAMKQSKDLMFASGHLHSEEDRGRVFETVSLEIANAVAEIERLRALDGFDIGVQRGALTLFDEYLSQTYVQYLGTLRAALVSSAKETPKETKDSAIERLLDLAQAKEAQHRSSVGLPDDRRLTDQEREERLLKLSLIKKYFQARTFVSVGRQPVMKKFSESTAIAGTAFAGIIAALVQRMDRNTLSDVTFSGFLLFCFGVFVYVLRDRLKDWAREKFSERISKVLPDFEQELEIHDTRVGLVQEWFGVSKKSEMTSEVMALRRQAYTSVFEEQLPEEVLHYRRRQIFEYPHSNSDKPAPRAIHELVRVNIERYLKYMDDPIKDILSMDNYGKLFKSQSRRVYHFYLCLRSRVFLNPQERIPTWRRLLGKTETGPCLYQDLVYRVVLHKPGIIRLEKVEF